MTTILTFFVWCVLWVLCWPLALLALLLAPILWLMALPFRLAGAAISGVFSLVKALFFLPARLLGART